MSEVTQKKPVVVFVHGGQGCGKSTVTNLLRECWTHTSLLRLAGVPSQQENAAEKSKQYHYELLKSIQAIGSHQTGMNFVFDRSFLCEKIYANLGFKAYDFKEQTAFLHEEGLKPLLEHYRVYMVLLTASEQTLQRRLNRKDKPQFEQVVFEASNSLAQQSEYRKEFASLPEGIETIILPTDGRTGEESVKCLLASIQK